MGAVNLSLYQLFESTAFLDTPSQRVQFLLGTEDDDEEHIPHDLFTEMDEICVREGADSEWRESARYCQHGHIIYKVLAESSD